MTDLLFLLLWFGVQCTVGDQHCLRQVPALPVTAQGIVSPYAPGVAEDVMRRRIRYFDELHPRYGHVPDCLAALNGDFVGEYAVVMHGSDWSLCWIVDCAWPEHAVVRDAAGLVLEVNHESFERWGNEAVVVSVLPSLSE